MSIAPGIPIRPAEGTVVLNHTFTDITKAAIVGLSADTVSIGPNVFKEAPGISVFSDIVQNNATYSKQGVGGSGDADNPAQHWFNAAYAGDRDVEIDLSLPVDNDTIDIAYRGDGKDVVTDSFQLVARFQSRVGDGVIRIRVRGADGAGSSANRTLDNGAANFDYPTSDVLGEHSILIEDREDKVLIYIDGVFATSYTYLASTDGAFGLGCSSCVFPIANLYGFVEIGLNPKDPGIVMDNFKVTLR